MNISEFVGDSRKVTYALGVGIALLVFIALILVIRGSGIGGSSTQSADITVWGVFDDELKFNDAITAFEKDHKNINVTYRLIPYPEYERTLLNALASNTGPDVLMIHHTWLGKHGDKLLPMPSKVPGTDVPLMTVRQFKETFVDVAAADLIGNETTIYAMPLYVDTLALYTNKDALSAAGITTPPKDWKEFQDDVVKLTQKDKNGAIVRAGASMGTATNINRASDILMMLMLQSGVQMVNTDGTQATFAHSVDNQPVGERSTQFYVDFANPKKGIYTWNDAMDYSIDAFASGKSAMMINYAHQIDTVRQKSPRLNWSIAAIPQPPHDDTVVFNPITYANYWALAVSKSSKYPNEAWEFVNFMTAGAGTVPYLTATNRPAARRDLISQQKDDTTLGVFAEQALTARSWYQVDNLAIEKLFTDMINAINLNQATFSDALRTVESQVSVLMAR